MVIHVQVILVTMKYLACLVLIFDYAGTSVLLKLCDCDFGFARIKDVFQNL